MDRQSTPGETKRHSHLPRFPSHITFGLSLVLSSESLMSTLHLPNSLHSRANEFWTTDQWQKGHWGHIPGVENRTLLMTAEQ